MSLQKSQRGSAILEFTLVGIMFLFILISIVQMAIGMWQYHTIQYAVKTAGAYATFHGSTCSKYGNNCVVQIQDVAAVLKKNAIGVDPQRVTVTFNVMASDHVTPVSAKTVTCQLSGGGGACDTNATAWPPSGYNDPGTDLEIKTEFQYRSALAMGGPAGPVQFGSFWFPGFTHQTIMF